MDSVLSNIFLKKSAQEVRLLLIEQRKVAQECKLGYGHPMQSAKRRDSQLILNSYGVFNLDVPEDQIADRFDHEIRGYQPTAKCESGIFGRKGSGHCP